jgi:hypothetical protein
MNITTRVAAMVKKPTAFCHSERLVSGARNLLFLSSNETAGSSTTPSRSLRLWSE